MKRYLILFTALCLSQLVSAAPAISLQTKITKVAEEGGRAVDPIGRWVGSGDLQIRFTVQLEDFRKVDPNSMQYQLTGDTIKLTYRVVEVPHAPDAPVALCYSTRALVYDLKGIPEKEYQIEVDGPDAVAAHPLPMVHLSAGVPNAVKVSVLDEGKTLLLDGKAATKEQIEDTIKSGDRLQTAVWIYMDTSSPVGEEILEFAIDQQVPVAPADKQDFSDVIASIKTADKPIEK